MKSINLMQAVDQTKPQPVALICTRQPDGGTNLAPVTWWTYLETNPPMVGFSMSKSSYTHELAAVVGAKLAITLPGQEIAEAVLKCGGVSGRKINKAEEFNIELTGEDVKYPVQSKVVFVCTVRQVAPAGHCEFIMCEADEILLDDAKQNIFHLPGRHELGVV